MLDMIITGQALRRATNEIFVFFLFYFRNPYLPAKDCV